MKFLQRVFASKLREVSAVSRGQRRPLQFETMEQRVVLSADLMAAVATYEPVCENNGFKLHSLSVLPVAADPVAPLQTLSTVTPATLADTFQLHSAPGARHTIFLDFDGHVTSGTIWNTNYNSSQDIVTPAFDFDGDATSFSSAELQRIQWIWERVAEDFIPFNVDVTTEVPGVAALSKNGSSDLEWGARLVIGGSSGDWWGPAAGGVAYVGSFNWSSDSPGFVFEDQLGNGNEKYTAEAISHEAGHMLGLSHDGRLSPSEEYFQGQGSGITGWAPIMGSGYYQNVTQWSQGEYASANQTQDDLAFISGNNGFTYRTDDHGNSNATASPLRVNNELISDWGIIERSSDVDVFSFNTNAGFIQIDVNPLDRGPNLDVVLELFDSSNNVVARSNPTDLLSASINVPLAAQQYFLHVAGTSKGDPGTNGYSDYASLGQYFISGTLIPVQNDFVSISTADAIKAEGDSGSTSFTFDVSRSGNTNSSTTVDYSVSGSGPNAATADDFWGGVLPTGSVTFAPGETSQVITITVAGDSEVENDEGFTVSLSNASGETVTNNASSTGLILNDDAVVLAGVSVTPTSGLTIRENGTSATFNVVLDSQPTADVTIAVSSLDTTEGLTNTNLLRFKPSDWNIPQTVIVTGVDDNIRDGNTTFMIDLGATQSNDENYNTLQVQNVQVTNQDDERGKGAGKGGGAEKGKKGSRAADIPTFTTTATATSVPHIAMQPHSFVSEGRATDGSASRLSIKQEQRELRRSSTAKDADDTRVRRVEPRVLSSAALASKANAGHAGADVAAIDRAIAELSDSLDTWMSAFDSR